MRPEDFRPDDLFAQIQGLVDGLTAERRARELAEAADKAKSELLAMVGHELRSPMEAVTAMAELLLASPLDPTQARYAEMLYQSSRSLLGVLNDVLDFSRLDGGRMALQHVNFDLHDLVQGVGTVLQTRANDKGLTGGVDIGAIEFIHRRLVAERDGGAAILLVSAELDEVRSLSDRIAVMYEGRIVSIEPPDASEERLGLLMTGGGTGDRLKAG